MKNKYFEIKGFTPDSSDSLELVKGYVKDEDKLKLCKVYTAVAYTTEVDRDNEQVDLEGLTVMKEKIISKPICIDHNSWCADGIVGRVIDAYIEGSSLIVKFYTPYKEAQEKIDTGIYYNMSLGFGADTDSTDADGVRHLKVYDVYELSIVCVPAIRDAHIKSYKIKGGIQMTFKEFKFKQFKSNNPDLAEKIKSLEEIENPDAVLTDADVEALFNENEELKARCKELEDALEACKQAQLKADCNEAINTEIEKAVCEMDPANDDTKAVMIDEVKSFKLTAEIVDAGTEGAFVTKSGTSVKVSGLTDVLDKVKTKYTKLGLIGKKEKSVDFSVPNSTEKEKSFDRGFTFTLD